QLRRAARALPPERQRHAPQPVHRVALRQIPRGGQARVLWVTRVPGLGPVLKAQRKRKGGERARVRD
ncbi:MAG: hypothetical protein ACK55Z_28395, partial [bacterium]